MRSNLSRFRCLVLACTVGSSFSVLAQEFARASLPESHPLVGHWRTEFPGSKCVEEFQLRADGTRSTTSAAEQSESELRLPWAPSGDEFFKWEDKVVKTNGKPGCSGASSKIGRVSVTYIRLHPDGEKLLLCTKEDMKSCFTEFKKVK